MNRFGVQNPEVGICTRHSMLFPELDSLVTRIKVGRFTLLCHPKDSQKHSYHKWSSFKQRASEIRQLFGLRILVIVVEAQDIHFKRQFGMT